MPRLYQTHSKPPMTTVLGSGNFNASCKFFFAEAALDQVMKLRHAQTTLARHLTDQRVADIAFSMGHLRSDLGLLLVKEEIESSMIPSIRFNEALGRKPLSNNSAGICPSSHLSESTS